MSTKSRIIHKNRRLYITEVKRETGISRDNVIAFLKTYQKGHKKHSLPAINKLRNAIQGADLDYNGKREGHI